MSMIEWRPDKGTHVVLRSPLFAKRRVEVNGQRVEGTWESKHFDFSLPDGRAASIHLKADTMSRQTELLVDRTLIPDTRVVPKDLRCPACKAEIELLDEYCTKCGHALGSPSRFVRLQSVQGATTAIRVLAVIFALFGVIMYFVQQDDANEALKSLSEFQDDEVLQPIGGVTYTAGELRKQVLWEHRGTLVINLILSVLMLILAWWSKRKPLAAILIATAIYASLQVVNAIIDPTTIAQGIIIKIIIVSVLVRGIKGAFDMRAENG
jgi:hypothetical protein